MTSNGTYVVTIDATRKELVMDPVKEMEARQQAFDARFKELQEELPAALRTLLALATEAPEKRYGIAAAELIRAAHRKGGAVEMGNLRSLDSENLAAALIVIEALAHPSALSDRGLAFTGYGDPLLTSAEVAKIPA